MPENKRFSPGQTVVLRQMSFGKIWTARPYILIRDTPELLAFFLPRSTVWKEPEADIRPVMRISQPWRLKDSVWAFGGILRLAVPGANYSVLQLVNVDGSTFRWYINLEEPLIRTKIGFDYNDLVLDVLIEPGLLNWRWKDEDELAEMVEAGLFTKAQAAWLYDEGKKAVDWLQSGSSPFNEWIKWQPDPAWLIPVLPKGWDKI